MSRRWIIALCFALACYNHEARHLDIALQDNLTQMRKAIDNYYAKNHRYPHALQDLVRDGELRKIPNDPITKLPTWRTTVQESVTTNDFGLSRAPAPPPAQGIVDVHSSAPGKDKNGRAWSDY